MPVIPQKSKNTPKADINSPSFTEAFSSRMTEDPKFTPWLSSEALFACVLGPFLALRIDLKEPFTVPSHQAFGFCFYLSLA